uniref:Uncharacterized protein n=1 Tax=Lepeophtheirus salmonis TaxID=72036 RepID=A0A0K2SWG1_LEPSM
MKYGGVMEPAPKIMTSVGFLYFKTVGT